MAITKNIVWCHLVDHNFKGLDLPFTVEVEDETIVADVRRKVTAVYQITPPRRLLVWRCKDPELLLNPADDDSVDRIICTIDFSDQTKVIKLGGGMNVMQLGLAEYEVLLVQAQEAPDDAPELPEHQCYNRIIQGMSLYEAHNSAEHGSTQQDPLQAIYNGLAPESAPFDTVAPPIHIYHPIFDEFTSLLAQCSGRQVAIDDQVQTLEVMRKMSVIYEDEFAYTRAVHPILGKLLGFELMDDLAAVPFLQVVKSSIESSVDLSTQAGVSMRRYWIDSSRRSTLEKCCCPTFIIAASGPWFCVFGAIFTDKIIVQPLTDLRWSALSSTMEESRILENARILVALRTCLNKLKEYYDDILDAGIAPLLPNVPHPRFFPYPKSFTKPDGSEVKFEYIKPMEDVSTCVTFLAKTAGDSLLQGLSKKIVVKFVSRYGKALHQYLSTKNRAPKLHYFGPLSSTTGSTSNSPNPNPGGMKMVVMEYIERKPDQDIPANARKQLEEILMDLHSQGFVFGDLRWQNIPFDKSNRAFLIDFNWGGRYDTKAIRDSDGIPKGVQKDVWEKIKTRVARVESVDFDGLYARYPLAISKVDGMWVDGVGPGELILPQHDWGMLDKLDFSNECRSF